MANIREIKGRINSVKNTQQITKAMQMVAAAKVRRAQDRVSQARPYAEKLEAVLKEVAPYLAGEDLEEPLLEVRPVQRVGVVIVTSDKGLSGAYNSNVLRASATLLRKLRADGTEPKLWLIGNKAINLYKHSNYEIAKTYSGLNVIPSFAEAKEIVGGLVDAFKSGEVDKVVVVYTQFKSMMSFVVSELDLLPVAAPRAEGEAKAGIKPSYTFEPSAAALVSAVLPRYTETLVYRALLESAASQLANQMTAMSAATKNAKDMLNSLTLYYNKARQAIITGEILEVVGGAEAMRG